MRTARRTHGFTESVIRGMTRLANEYGAINLSQGFPNFPCPDVLKDAAARAIRDDMNQYAITWGAVRLRNALAAKYQEWYGLAVDPTTQVTVTCGATEAMVSSLLGIVNPGDEVVVFEPFYENYGPDAILCDAKPVFVPMPAEGPIDLDRLAKAFTAKTRAIAVGREPLGDDYYEGLARDYRRRRDILCGGLVKAGFKCRPPQGAYYVMADFSDLSDLPDDEFARWLTAEHGVATVPGSSFYSRPELGRRYVRFAFCKTEDMLQQAVERLQRVRGQSALSISR